ncbi:MAG: MBL fold metallo-hydrolase [Rhodospirillaceae bacterium]
MKCVELFRQGNHSWLAFGQDPAKPDAVIDTTQIVITSGGQSMLLDPGGSEIFPAMIAALTARLPIDSIQHMLLSHQDPDVGSSVGLWRRVCGDSLNVHASWMWTSFLAHFDGDGAFVPIPDEGSVVRLGGRDIHILPAHYLHSPGNFSVYDPVARILFSGDIGAALVPADKRRSFFVEDFSGHIGYMQGFHERWMPSAAARDAWVAMVSRLDIDMLAPQHGLIFRGDDVKRFLDWLMTVQIGSDLSSFEKAAQRSFRVVA